MYTCQNRERKIISDFCYIRSKTQNSTIRCDYFVICNRFLYYWPFTEHIKNSLHEGGVAGIYDYDPYAA
jgi:hypothetical protein